MLSDNQFKKIIPGLLHCALFLFSSEIIKECKFHNESRGWAYVKKGYFKTKWNAQPVPRYRCRECGKYFSSHTFRASYGQKKPYLNQEVFKWYASGTTLRRMAIVMGVSRVTITRKFLFMAELARKEHACRVQAAEMNCKGHLAVISQMKYGWRKDSRNVAREDVLRLLNQCSREWLVVVTDKKTDYPAILKKCVPHAERLQAHLHLYIAFNNGYSLAA